MPRERERSASSSALWSDPLTGVIWISSDKHFMRTAKSDQSLPGHILSMCMFVCACSVTSNYRSDPNFSDRQVSASSIDIMVY